MSFASGIIDISLDFSKAQALIAETLNKTVLVEKKQDVLEAEVELTAKEQEIQRAQAQFLRDQTRRAIEGLKGFQTKERVLEDSTRRLNEELGRIEARHAKLVDDVDKTKADISATVTSAIATFRRAAAFGTYLFSALGSGIGQALTLLAETIGLTIETARAALAIDFAEASANPWKALYFLGTIGVRVALIAGLVVLFDKTVRQKNRVSSEFNAAVGALRIITI